MLPPELSRVILFTGSRETDAVMDPPEVAASIAPSIFSVDRSAAIASIHRLAELDPNVILAGHGWPWIEGTATALRVYAATLRS